jgi:predicted acylesterase/phospholipase RssA
MLPLILILASLLVVVPAHGQVCRPARTALVLSGGGAKGLAHIGLLRVMDSLGIRPDLIVGASMGAAIGALYASGYSGRELDSLSRAADLNQLFRAHPPRAPRSLGPLQPLVVWEQGERRFSLQSPGIVEAEVNALVNAAMLRGNLIARGNFDSLPVPFRAVATDLATRRAVVLDSGDLARAVRASVAIPLLFAPEYTDQGRILVDGGLSANIPVRIARSLGAERVIVSDATEHTTDSLDVYSLISVADRLVQFLFQQQADSLHDTDVVVRPAIEGFTSLNFSPRKVDSLLALGRMAADTVLPRLRCRPLGSPRSSPRLPSTITGVEVKGVATGERLALERLLGLGLNDSLDFELLLSRVRSLGTTAEAYHAVWLGPSGAGDSVGFQLKLRRAARRVAGLGLVYDNELGGRMWAGLVDRSVFGAAMEGSGAILLGELRRELYLGLRRKYQVGRQLLDPTLSIRLATENVRRFGTGGDELPEAETREAIGFAGAERILDQNWEAALGIYGHTWREPVRGNLSTLGGVARITRTTRTRGRVFLAEGIWTGVYRRAALEGEATLQLGSFRVTPRVRLGWGEGLPLQSTFPLGGDDGFPGLHIGERRGDREAMVGVMFTVPIRRPLLARIEFAGGRTALGGGFLEGDWVGGVRAGIGADTPVGPVRLEYGYSTEDRGALLLRLGRWF